MYQQVYDPVAGSLGLTSLFAAIPLTLMFVMLGVFKRSPQLSALVSLAATVAVATLVYPMPFSAALTLPRLCRAVPRPDPQAGRRCDPRQSRLPQGQGGAEGHPSCRSPPRLPAQILPRPQPDRAGLRQVQDAAAKGRSASYEAISD